MTSGYDNSFRRQIEQILADEAADPVLATGRPSPVNLDILMSKAVAHHQAGQLPQAEALYRQILQAVPTHSGALNLLGVIASQIGQHTAAIELIDKAIQIHPQFAEAYHNRGAALSALRQYRAALEDYDKSILLCPTSAEAHLARATALGAMEQHQPALKSCDEAIRLRPEFADAYYHRGNTLNVLGQHEAALENYDKAILLKPEFAEAYCNRGILLSVLERYQVALESCNRAILLNPNMAEAYFGRGVALFATEQHQPALENYDRAIQLKPDFAEAHNNRGNALLALKRYEAAMQSYDTVILLRPGCLEAHNNRGNLLQIIGKYHAALDSYNKAFLLKPEHEYLQGARLLMKRHLCDWEDADSECKELEARIVCGLKVAPPFVTLATGDSPAIQRQAAEIYARNRASAHITATAIPRRPRHDRIRVGYFSTDYYNHATSYLMAEIFELHDRDRFEVLGFSFGPNVVDEMSRRVSAAMDRFLDIRSMANREAAEFSRRLEVDIAVDLKAYTREDRAGIFAERAAPIQVNYLGYPGTMGVEYMDYLIADQTVIPEASRQFYSEKIVYLPDSYQPNDSRRAISAKSFSRVNEGLPEMAFVFCCFSKAYKITPAVFDVWMRILGRVDGSVLWLLESDPRASENLRKEARRRGICPERLVFAQALPLDEHLARHRLADLFLDTLPYNAHTTASDALWSGLPVLTRIGETFAGRVAASLLCAVNLPQLITTTEVEFEEMAIGLAHDTERLQTIRRMLQRNRLDAPLFDSHAFTRNLEAAYTAMIERYDAGLAPEHILIPRNRLRA